MRTPFLFLITFLWALNGCTSPQENTKPIVYTTVYPLYYFTSTIGGDFIEVKSAFPAGADAHDYEPSPRDFVAFASADLFISINEEMEPFISTVESTLKNERVVFLSTYAIEEMDHEHDNDHLHDTLHPWMSPLESIEIALKIRDGLIQINPSNRSTFEQNFEALKTDLLNLHDEYTSALSKYENKSILVTHGAFGFWEELYGIKQLSILGIGGNNEPSQKQLTDLIEEAKSLNITTIFVDPLHPSRLE
jgi:zinc transport system substrate-binding protein